MSDSIAVAVRRRRSHAEVERLVEEFEHSGLTRRAFCAQNGLSAASLDNYRKRVRSLASSSQSGIVAVELVGRASGERRGTLWVELINGRRIEVVSGFDALTLERLVTALERV